MTDWIELQPKVKGPVVALRFGSAGYSKCDVVMTAAATKYINFPEGQVRAFLSKDGQKLRLTFDPQGPYKAVRRNTGETSVSITKAAKWKRGVAPLLAASSGEDATNWFEFDITQVFDSMSVPVEIQPRKVVDIPCNIGSDQAKPLTPAPELTVVQTTAEKKGPGRPKRILASDIPVNVGTKVRLVRDIVPTGLKTALVKGTIGHVQTSSPSDGTVTVRFGNNCSFRFSLIDLEVVN